MKIRPIILTDVDRFWALRLRALKECPEAFGSSYEEEIDKPREAIERRLRQDIAPPNSFILAAEAEDTFLGMAGFWRHERKKRRHLGGIWGVFVVPEAQGRGIGRALMTEAIARAEKLADLEQIMLSVTAGNEAARNLYVSMGFEPFGVEPRALKLNDRYLDEEYMMLFLNRQK
jgi:ribosomal protein S18 acetylase RimI-like enzyme